MGLKKNLEKASTLKAGKNKSGVCTDEGIGIGIGIDREAEEQSGLGRVLY